MTDNALLAALKRGERTAIARAITLVESASPEHQRTADALLSQLMPGHQRSLRVAITGVPGAGKSTFIEALGLALIAQGKKVGVLAIDPSSPLTGGAILGDKTRMVALSRSENAFIRPSPSRGALGGVTAGTLEAIWILEAAGYDVILVETVGVGQSEIAARALVDCFALLMLPNAGDDLQGIKRGIMEQTDLVFVNKAEGENRTAAERARLELLQALACLRPATAEWTAPVLCGAAKTGDGIDDFAAALWRFDAHIRAQNLLAPRRSEQMRQWLRERVSHVLLEKFWAHPGVATQFADLATRLSGAPGGIAQEIAALLRLAGLS